MKPASWNALWIVRTRRRVAATAAAGVLLLLGAGGGQAHASPRQEPSLSPNRTVTGQLEVPEALNLTLPAEADSEGYVAPSLPQYNYKFTPPGPVHNLRLVIDATDLRGIAEIKPNYGICKAKDLVVTCLNKGKAQDHTYASWVTLTAAPGARAGATGDLKYRLSVDESKTPATATTQVTAGTPKLVISELPDRSGLRTDDIVELPFKLRNIGSTPVKEFSLGLGATPGLEIVRLPRNCQWESQGPFCDFRTPVAAGQTVQFSRPIAVRVTEEALRPWVGYRIEPRLLPDRADKRGTPGTAPPVSLVPTSGGDFAAAEEGYPGARKLELAAVGNHADFSVKADGLKSAGGLGEPASLTFSVRNEGPAAAFRIDNKDLVYLDITLPPGATVPAPSDDGGDGEEEEQDGRPCVPHGERVHRCPIGYFFDSDEGLEPGEVRQVILPLADSAFAGSVTARLVPAPGFSTDDPNPANDIAAITANDRSESEPAATSDAKSAPSTGLIAGATATGSVAVLAAVTLAVRRRRPKGS
ncbi:hypothetical protein ACFC96_35465 [Streptomyces sp. NPDC055955]|uniref:hypothetical protein n=1 Tax=Streptomyces sp. NPDC055955 TaxID=3345665 RepID=UPI0035D83963